jgi:DNA helicase-2/ATP-dependent DNA helicase PcrA
MEERIDKILPYGYFQMWTLTFHAWADRILRAEAPAIGVPPAYKIITEAESVIFLRDNLFLFDLHYFRPLGNPNKFLESLIAHFSRLKDEDISPEQYLRWAKKTTEDRLMNLELARAYELYQKLKIKAGYLDFSDLIYYQLKLFRTRKNILKKYQNYFKYVLVDEFQDTNIAQYELVKLLCAPGTNSPRLTIVGDDSQAIYKFRGASVSNILSFMRDYSRSQQVTLRRNFRSYQPVLDTAYRLIKHNDPDTLEAQLGISKNLISVRSQSEKVKKNQSTVRFSLNQDAIAEADFVAREILKLKNKYSYSDFAILVRANNYAEYFTRALAQNGIPYQFWGPGQLFKQPEIRDLIAYLHILSNLEDSLSLYRVLSMNIFNIEARDILLLLGFAKKCSLSLFQALEVFLSFFDKELSQKEYMIYKKYLPKISLLTSEKLAIFYKMLIRHIKLSKRETAGQVLFYFLEDSKYLPTLVNYKTERDERRALNISKFFTKIKNFETEHEDASVFAVVDWIKMNMELGESPMVENEKFLYDAVNILTVHSTKGLEWPVVFLVNLVEGRFPSRQRKDVIPIPEALIKEILPKGDHHVLEERRLFYVGVTRARDRLYLTAAKFYGEGKRERKISPFVIEALGDRIMKEADSRINTAPSTIIAYKKVDEEIIKKELTLNLFSFSQINTFLSCPLQYKLRYILRIPEPISSAASFGSTIHNTLESFYREFSKNKKTGIGRLLEIYKSSWIPLGYTSAAHQRLRIKDGQNMLRNFYKKLHNPRLQLIDLEKLFTIKVNGVNITGKIDRVDKKNNGQIEIIDYKTGKIGTQKDVQKNLQLAIYLLAATNPELYNKKPDEVILSFYFLQSAEKVSVKKTDETLAGIRAQVANIINKIHSTDFASPHLLGCGRCSYCRQFGQSSY